MDDMYEEDARQHQEHAETQEPRERALWELEMAYKNAVELCGEKVAEQVIANTITAVQEVDIEIEKPF